jgi:hypothetical protein
MEFVIWVETRISDRTFDKQMVAKIERPVSPLFREQYPMFRRTASASPLPIW